MNESERVRIAIECGWLVAGLPAVSFSHSLCNLLSGFGKAEEVYPMICGWTAFHRKNNPIERAYHYTSIEGMEGILLTPVSVKTSLISNLCANTDFSDMFAMGVKPVGSSNDSSEGGAYCKEIFELMLSDMLEEKLITESFVQLVSDVISRGDTYKKWPEILEYMACFSAARDSETMWKGYSNGQGVALGFDFQNSELLFPLMYLRTEQEFCVRKACEALCKIFNEEYMQGKDEVERAISAAFELFSGRFKKEDSVDEQEWRLRIIDEDNEFGDRVSDERLLVALPKSYLKEIICSPGTSNEQVEEIRRRLESAGYSINVSTSLLTVAN